VLSLSQTQNGHGVTKTPHPSSAHTTLVSQVLRIPLLGALFHMESGTLKQLWATFQILSSISFNLDVVFPEP